MLLFTPNCGPTAQMPKSWLIKADSILVGSSLAFLFLLKGQSLQQRWAEKHNRTAQPATASSRIIFCIVPPRVFLGALARDLVLLTPPSANTLLHRRFYCIAVMNISHRKAQLLQPERKICLFQGRGHTFVTCKKTTKNTSLTRRLCSSLQNPVAVSLKNIFSA